MFGLGHVGGALAKRLVEDAETISRAANRPIRLEAIAVARSRKLMMSLRGMPQ